jgi:hypothetical protein
VAVADPVQLTDLDVITRYSIAVRRATVERTELIATLRGDLAWLEHGRRRDSWDVAQPVRQESSSTAQPEPGSQDLAETETAAPQPPPRESAAPKPPPPKLPLPKPTAAKRPAVSPTPKPAAKRAAAKRTPAKRSTAKRATKRTR